MQTSTPSTASRVSTIDMCRGLLFILMANTHALGLANVTRSHWLLSDLWLPNGWATIVFVVLSGYSAGYLLSSRVPEIERDRALRRRAVEILAVMFVSNLIFAILREVARGDTNAIFQPEWYIGFFTLDTEWTISGVLLPTALVLLIAPWIMTKIKNYPALTLIALLMSIILISMLRLQFRSMPISQTWTAKFLLFNGFGGFPPIPFLLNGCLGIWLGMAHRRNEQMLIPILVGLTVLQFLLYSLTFLQTNYHINLLFYSAGAVAKFGSVFLVAVVFVHLLPRWLSSAIEIMGRFALGSFVMHRVFMQSIVILFVMLKLNSIEPTHKYALLFILTIFLTWLLCQLRELIPYIDYPFRKLRI